MSKIGVKPCVCCLGSDFELKGRGVTPCGATPLCGGSAQVLTSFLAQPLGDDFSVLYFLDQSTLIEEIMTCAALVWWTLVSQVVL